MAGVGLAGGVCESVSCSGVPGGVLNARAAPAPGRRVPRLPARLPVLSLSRINEKSVWCCGWLPCTPLRIAATAGHGNCVDFLIRKGAEVDLVDVKGQTALYVAVVNGHLESAQILLEAGADPNGSRHHRSTPVYHASRVGRADILKALIRSVLGLRPAAAAAFSFLIFSPSQSRLVTGFVCFVFFKSCFLALSVLLFSDWLISIFIYFCPCFPWFSSTFSLTF